jgi:hydroxyethylthiazole kinase-like uncharacterized protein yjeF
VLKLVTAEQMRSLEKDTEALGLPGPALMELAGRAVADVIRERMPQLRGQKVLVACGPGNNGGDGLVVARHLHDAGGRVTVYLVNRPRIGDAKERLLDQRQILHISLADDPDLARLDATLANSDLIVDAVFGTGRRRPIEGAVGAVLDRLSAGANDRVVVALDLPSGADADIGAADPHTVTATYTVTLGFPKRSLVLGEAARRAGELVVADIGLPRELGASLSLDYADAASIRPLLPARPRVSHKGTFGRVLIVAGSRRYTGAPVLAASAAERIGAGLVTLACPESVRDSLAMHTLETTFLPLPDEGSGELIPASLEPLFAALDSYDAVLVGPGIGRSARTTAFLERLLPRLVERARPVVIDADGLTILAGWPRWWERVPSGSILTPHPGEMARLAGPQAEEDRIDLAVHSSTAWSTIIVLKGAYTIVARPNGQATVLPFANPALATAGTGDVLAGTILGLLSQGTEPASAALAGAFVHGMAGERLSQQSGVAGGLASELASCLPGAAAAVRGALATGSGGW